MAEGRGKRRETPLLHKAKAGEYSALQGQALRGVICNCLRTVLFDVGVSSFTEPINILGHLIEIEVHGASFPAILTQWDLEICFLQPAPPSSAA